MIAAAVASLEDTPNPTSPATSTASCTPMPPGVGARPPRSTAPTTTARAPPSPTSPPTAITESHMVAPSTSCEAKLLENSTTARRGSSMRTPSAWRASRKILRTRVRSDPMATTATTPATTTATAITRTRAQFSPDDPVVNPKSTSPKANPTSRMATCTMNDEKLSTAPCVTAAVGVRPNLLR